ncbi:MAG: hypothetical protein OXI77_14375 [Chloroflexota bacterium]|nr:hypothetical protein [Chloroflexota bacterium]MDE2910644.1 hypothetical protein [Chloroflexota bacterium]
MKAKISIATLALLAIASAAFAQVDNCCFVDRQCVSDQEWDAGYWAFQNNQCAAPPQAQPAPAATSSTPVDNCCGIDRQCQTDQDWTNGYWAFQTNQCAASIGSQQGAPASVSAQPLVSTPLMPEGVKRLLANPFTDPFNNCCFMHHDTCHSDEDWRRGHWQYHNHQCIHPAPLGTRPAITGDHPKFTKLVNDALHLIGLHAPKWLHYIDNSGAREFRLMPLGAAGGFYNQVWIIGLQWLDWERNDPNWHPDRKYVVGYAGFITHEACHAIKQRTYTQTNDWLNEADCEEARLDVIYSIWPESPDVGWLQASVADYHARAGISS